MSSVWQPLAVMVIAAALAGGPAAAQEGWNPFQEKDAAAQRLKRKAPEAVQAPPLQPMEGSYPGAAAVRGSPYERGPAPGFGSAYPGADVPPAYAQPVQSRDGDGRGEPRQALNATKIERFDLEPATAAAVVADASGLPRDVWRGMDLKTIEESFATLPMPSRSAALSGLWRRLLTASVDAPEASGTRNAGKAPFDALRLEALYRSGSIEAMGPVLETAPTDEPLFRWFAIRRDLALGKREAVCANARQLMGRRGDLPKPMAGELHLLGGYCAAAEGNAGGAGVAADLAREDDVEAPVALAALDALAGNGKGPLTPPKRVGVLDYRLLELLGPIDPAQILDRAEPALASAMAIGEPGLKDTADPRTRVAAAEAAARLNAIATEQLAAAYKAAQDGADDAMLRRAELIRVIGAEASMSRKVQLMKAALDDARRSDLLGPTARVLAPMLAGVTPSPETQAQIDSVVEIALTAGDTQRARAFAVGGNAQYWLPLIDIAEAGVSEQQREQDLGVLDGVVRRGRLPADLLHRLATVLDATDVNVPLPLWEAAGRAPQPAGGYLPETGVLAQLQEAAKKKEVARTIVLAIRALGPAGPEGAHIIALGDTMRALRRAGFEREARALAVEALIGQWPRGGAT